MIPASFIQDVISRTDVAEVVGRYVTLKKAGINYKGLCPFHGEKTPSFIVSPTRQTYHCFGCGAHGDAIRFLVDHAGIGFVDAVEELASAAGLQVPQEVQSEASRAQAQAQRQEQSQLTDILSKAAHYYKHQLKESSRAIDYLKKRGLTGEIARQFALGYAPASWRSLANVYPSYDDAQLEVAGLVISHQEAASGGESEARDGKRYDRFRDRIMFPIRNVKGEIIGFGGRILDQGEPKYLNSPETPVFSKGRELYGLYEARTAIRNRGYALVTEGYMDVVALAQSGFPNAVATLGTACTADHIHKLMRFTDKVVFSFDGDNAGQKAAARALESALPHAQDTKTFSFLFLPSEHDPDSFIRQFGQAAFEKQVQEAMPLSQYLLDLSARDCDLETAEGRARMLAQARPLWTQLPDGVLKLQLLDELTLKGQIASQDLLRLWKQHQQETKKTIAQEGVKPSSTPYSSGPRVTRYAWRQGAANLLDRVLWLLIYRPALWHDISADLQSQLTSESIPYGETFLWVERESHSAEDLSAAELGPEQSPEMIALIQKVRQFFPPDADIDFQRELNTLLKRLELQSIQQELTLLLESGELSAQAQQRGRVLMSRQSELKKTIN